MNTKKIDQIDKRDDIREILLKIIKSELMSNFAKTPLGKLLVTPQNRSYWIKQNPPDALCTGYALKSFEESEKLQQKAGNSVEQAYPSDVLRTGMWAKNSLHFFGIDSSGSLLIIRYWDDVHSNRTTLFSHRTITAESVILSNYTKKIITPDDDETDIEFPMPQNMLSNPKKWLWQFKVHLKPHKVRSFGYVIEFPKGISDGDANFWMLANATIPVENLRIILCVPASIVKREPNWVSFAYNPETELLIHQMRTKDNFITELEKPDQLAELNPWLQIGRMQRFLGGDPHLPKKIESLFDEKKISFIGNSNTFFADFELVNPLIYHVVVFQKNRSFDNEKTDSDIKR